MATASVLSYPHLDELEMKYRRASMDSILGTMAAEGEFPSEQILALMDSYASGQMTHEQIVESMLANARRTAHEATTGGHAI